LLSFVRQNAPDWLRAGGGRRWQGVAPRAFVAYMPCWWLRIPDMLAGGLAFSWAGGAAYICQRMPA